MTDEPNGPGSPPPGEDPGNERSPGSGNDETRPVSGGEPRPGYGPPYPAAGSPPPGYGPPYPGSPPPPPGYGPPYPGAAPPPPGYPPPAPQPGIVPLRPLALDDLLFGGFRFIRANPGAVLLPPLIVTLISFALQAGLQALVFVNGGTRSGLGVLDVVLLIAVVLVSYLVYPPMLAVVASTLVPAVTGRRISLREAWAAARPNMGRMYGVYLVILLVGVVVIGIGYGLAVLIVANDRLEVSSLLWAALVVFLAYLVWVYLVVRLWPSISVTVVEGVGVRAAVRRSLELVRGSWWRMFGIQLLGGLLAGIAAFVVLIPFFVVGIVVLFSATTGSGGLNGPGVTGPFIAYFVIVAVGALVATVPTIGYMMGLSGLLYVDQRIRRERFDLQLLGQPNPG